jgi:hypothetical protein
MQGLIPKLYYFWNPNFKLVLLYFHKHL